MDSSIIGFLILAVGICVCLQFRQSWANANGRPAKTGAARLGRVKKASFIIQCLVWILLPMGAYSLAAFIFGWPQPGPHDMKVVIAPGHVYATATEVPPAVLPLWVVQPS